MEKLLEAIEGQLVTITVGRFVLQMNVRMINYDDEEVEIVDGDNASFTFPRKCVLQYQEGAYHLIAGEEEFILEL